MPKKDRFCELMVAYKERFGKLFSLPFAAPGVDDITEEDLMAMMEEALETGKPVDMRDPRWPWYGSWEPFDEMRCKGIEYVI